jgi:CNT family concentrative nucleoside transporter
MLIVFVALVALVDQILAFGPTVGSEPITLSRIFGWLLAPLAWLMGIPWEEAQAGGSLLGIKVVLNELLAYREFSLMDPGTFSERSRLILTYALCGFANFGSLGIMIGGIGAMAPERRGEVFQLGLRSILAGTLATCMTGAVVGILQ